MHCQYINERKVVYEGMAGVSVWKERNKRESALLDPAPTELSF